MTAASFKSMKKKRSAMFDDIKEQFTKKASSFQKEDDSMYWKPTKDKAGNGFAILRFLPPPGDEVHQFVRTIKYAWQGPNGWYIENSRKMLGQGAEDPCFDYLNRLWNTGTEENKTLYRARKPRVQFVSNVLVVKDPANPENEGRVMLFRYPKTIWGMLQEQMHPEASEFEEVEERDPFDMDEGMNFVLRIKEKNGFPNYEASEWEGPSAVADGNEKEQEKLWNETISLAAIIADDGKNFKTFDALSERLGRVLGQSNVGAPTASAEAPNVGKVAAAAEEPSVGVNFDEDIFAGGGDDDDDDDISFFNDLNEDD